MPGRGRPRKPLAIARADGTAQREKGRYNGRTAPTAPSTGCGLGAAPDWLGEDGEAAFEAIKRTFPFVEETDRIAVEIMAMFYATVRDASATYQERRIAAKELRHYLSRFGGTPSDITGISDALLRRAALLGSKSDTQAEVRSEDCKSSAADLRAKLVGSKVH